MSYETQLLILVPTLIAALNMLRGSTSPTKWFKNKIVNATMWAAVVGLLCYGSIDDTRLVMLIVSSVPAMLIAMSFGWGEYVGGQLVNRPKKDTEVAVIDKLLVRFESNPRLWGFLGNTLRGLLGGLILALPFICVGLYLHAVLIVLGFSLMGLAFYLASLLKMFSDQWKVGEALMGLFIGLGLTLATIFKRKNDKKS